MITSIVLLAGLIAAQPAAEAADTKIEVRRLVRQLNADTKDQREAAEAALLKLGPPALEMLPRPDAQMPAEQAQRLTRIRNKLQTVQAEAATDGSRVTLHERGMKLSKVLAAIQQQTGNTIADLPRQAGAPIPDPEIDVAFDKTPFWTALDKVLDQGQASVYPYGQPNALQIVPRGPNDLPRSGRAVLNGPMRIEPLRVIAKREMRTSTPASLQVVLELAWEPRLKPIAVKQRMADVKAVDPSGAALAIDEPDAEKEAYPARGTSAVEMEVSLAMPGRNVKEIASLQGAFRAMLPGKMETFRFTDLLGGKKQETRIAGATVTLDEVRKNGDAWEVFMRLRFDDAGEALESHRNWVLQNDAYLEGADGKPIAYDSMETTARTKNEIGVGYVFAQSPEKLAFVYKTPGMILSKEFRYELKGVKLP